MYRSFLALVALVLVAGSVLAAETVPVIVWTEDFELDKAPPLQVYRVDQVDGKQAMIPVSELEVGKEVLLYLGGMENYTAYSGKVEGWTLAKGAASKVTPDRPSVGVHVQSILVPWNATIVGEKDKPLFVVWIERPDPNMGLEEWKDPTKKGPEEFGNSICYLAKYGTQKYAEIWSKRSDRSKNRFEHLSMVGPAGQVLTPVQEVVIVKQGLEQIMLNHYPSPMIGEVVEQVKKGQYTSLT